GRRICGEQAERLVRPFTHEARRSEILVQTTEPAFEQKRQRFLTRVIEIQRQFAARTREGELPTSGMGDVRAGILRRGGELLSVPVRGCGAGVCSSRIDIAQAALQ